MVSCLKAKCCCCCCYGCFRWYSLLSSRRGCVVCMMLLFAICYSPQKQVCAFGKISDVRVMRINPSCKAPTKATEAPLINLIISITTVWNELLLLEC